MTATLRPSASEGQNLRPYNRIASATSWPTVLSSGGSAGGSGSLDLVIVFNASRLQRPHV